jgi:hypothetical protein
MAKISKPMISKEEQRWQVEDALRTLQRAEEIRKDSKLMGQVKTSINNLQKMAFGGPVKKSIGSSKKK